MGQDEGWRVGLVKGWRVGLVEWVDWVGSEGNMVMWGFVGKVLNRRF